MRNSLLEVQDIDSYLLKEMPAGDAFMFQVKVLLQPELAEKVALQRQAHRLVVLAAREKQRQALDALYTKLSQEETFIRKIRKIFS